MSSFFFFFNDTATTEIYTLSLHDALPILEAGTGQWCFTVLREARGLDIEAPGAWTAAYWGSILGGRGVLGVVVDRLGPDRLLRGATLTAPAGGRVVPPGGGGPGGPRRLPLRAAPGA